MLTIEQAERLNANAKKNKGIPVKIPESNLTIKEVKANVVCKPDDRRAD